MATVATCGNRNQSRRHDHIVYFYAHVPILLSAGGINMANKTRTIGMGKDVLYEIIANDDGVSSTCLRRARRETNVASVFPKARLDRS